MKRGFYVHQVLDVNSGCSVAPIRRRWGDGRVTSAAGRGTRRNSRGNRRRRRALSPTESGRPVAARPRKRPSWAARTDINGVLFFLFLGFYCPNKDGRGFFFTFSTSGRRATRRGGGAIFFVHFFKTEFSSEKLLTASVYRPMSMISTDFAKPSVTGFCDQFNFLRRGVRPFVLSFFLPSFYRIFIASRCGSWCRNNFYRVDNIVMLKRMKLGLTLSEC